MKNRLFWNVFITIGILAIAFLISLSLQYVFQVQEHITTLFVFAVFLISLFTDGYGYGIVAAVISTMAVNYAFSFPFFRLNFTIPVNLLSTLIMIVIAIMTGTLTTKIKYHEAWKAEGEKERMRANLLRALSHDIRTPLTTIYGFSEALQKDWGELGQEQKNKMLSEIKEEADWLIRMVENLLAVTRIGSGQIRIRKVPIVVDELVDSALAKFHKNYPNIPVEVSLPDKLMVISIDPTLMEQVLNNLLENAVQHAKGMEHLWLHIFLNEKHVVFEVADDGCGVLPGKIKNLFSGGREELQTSDSGRRNIGIGLSVCATIVSAHGGDIFAENREEGGFVVRVILDMEEVEDE